MNSSGPSNANGWRRVPRKYGGKDDPRLKWEPDGQHSNSQYQLRKFDDLFYTVYCEMVNDMLEELVECRISNDKAGEEKAYFDILDIVSNEEYMVWHNFYYKIKASWPKKPEDEAMSKAYMDDVDLLHYKGMMIASLEERMRRDVKAKREISKANMIAFSTPWDSVPDLPKDVKERLYGPFDDYLYYGTIHNFTVPGIVKLITIAEREAVTFKGDPSTYNKKIRKVVKQNKDLLDAMADFDLHFPSMTEIVETNVNMTRIELSSEILRNDYEYKPIMMDKFKLTIKIWPNFSLKKAVEKNADIDYSRLMNFNCSCGRKKVKWSFICEYCFSAVNKLKLDKYDIEFSITREALGLNRFKTDKLKKIRMEQASTRLNLAFINYRYEKMRKNREKFLKYQEKKKAKKESLTQLKTLMESNKMLKQFKLESAIVKLGEKQYFVEGTGDVEELRSIKKRMEGADFDDKPPFLMNLNIQAEVDVRNSRDLARFKKLLETGVEKLMSIRVLEKICIDMDSYIYLKNAFGIVYNLVDNDLKKIIESTFDVIEANGRVGKIGDYFKVQWQDMYGWASHMCAYRLRTGKVDAFHIIMFLTDVWIMLNKSKKEIPPLFAGKDTMFLL
jgi:hypothetical protein